MKSGEPTYFQALHAVFLVPKAFIFVAIQPQADTLIQQLIENQSFIGIELAETLELEWNPGSWKRKSPETQQIGLPFDEKQTSDASTEKSGAIYGIYVNKKARFQHAKSVDGVLTIPKPLAL